MAKIFNGGDQVTKDWLNGVSKTVTDGLGDNVAPATIRVHINAEQAGAASQVQTNLDTHKADASIHTPSADVVLQAEKGVANGIPTLDGSTKIPATFLPATGGYAGVYDTQALMVAAAAGHTSGEVFLVTDDPTSTLNGEYTATATPPASIADYYFNSGAVAAHTHNAADVNVVALGVTVEADSADIHTDLDLKATDADLTDHTGTTEIHFADAVSNGQIHGRKDGAWAAVVAGTGDLKSNYDVQMVGDPELGQDIATKNSSEKVFNDRLAGYDVDGDALDLVVATGITDLDLIDNNSNYAINRNDITNYPPGMAIRGTLVTKVWSSNGRRTQIVYNHDNDDPSVWVRSRYSEYTPWYHIADSRLAPFTPEGALSSTNVQDAIVEAASLGGSSTTEDVSDVTGSRTVTAADAGKVLRCTGDNETITLTIAAGLADNMLFSIVHEGTSTLTINVAGTSGVLVNGVAEIFDVLDYGSGLYVVHSNNASSDSWAATGGKGGTVGDSTTEAAVILVPSPEGVDTTFVLDDGYMGKVIRLGGNNATITLDLPAGLLANGKIDIINQGGVNLKLNLTASGGASVNGTTLKVDMMNFDQIGYLGMFSQDNWHFAGGKA